MGDLYQLCLPLAHQPNLRLTWIRIRVQPESDASSICRTQVTTLAFTVCSSLLRGAEVLLVFFLVVRDLTSWNKRHGVLTLECIQAKNAFSPKC